MSKWTLFFRRFPLRVPSENGSDCLPPQLLGLLYGNTCLERGGEERMTDGGGGGKIRYANEPVWRPFREQSRTSLTEKRKKERLI